MHNVPEYKGMYQTTLILDLYAFDAVVTFQTMTEAEHNRPIPKLFSNRPSASAAEVFGLLRELIIFF